MYKLTVFIPENELEKVKQAMFNVGAGNIGNYANCCWQVKGMGQFMPLDGSNPHIGQKNITEEVDEWRVELVVPDSLIHQVVAKMKQAHPYETPAYDVIKLIDI